VTVYGWEWSVLVPSGGFLEFVAFCIFFAVVTQHKPKGAGKKPLEPWVWVVMNATIGFLLSLGANLVESVRVAVHGFDPAFPHNFDQRYLALLGWGFLVPFVWGFSAKHCTCPCHAVPHAVLHVHPCCDPGSEGWPPEIIFAERKPYERITLFPEDKGDKPPDGSDS
jgi:hypothetical protein